MPNNNKMPKGGPKQTRVFRGIRDVIVSNAASSTPAVFPMNTDSSGNYAGSLTLCPLGFSGLTFNVPTPNTAGTQIVPSITGIVSPYLPWLFNQSRGFERYRVTRCVLVWVSNVGSTVTGRIMLDSSTDYADVVSATGISTSTGGKTFDLASGATKEFRFPTDVDTSWKKVSSATQLVTTAGLVFPVSTVNDLAFTTVFVNIAGGPASTNAGSLFVEYDVEFKDPISYPANI